MPIAEKASRTIRAVSELPFTDAWPLCSSAFSRMADDMAALSPELRASAQRLASRELRAFRPASRVFGSRAAVLLATSPQCQWSLSKIPCSKVRTRYGAQV